MISNLIAVLVGGSCFLYTFHVVYNFMYFTSTQNVNRKPMVQTNTETNVLMILWKLLMDTCLFSIFILQHSIMASNIIKNIYERLNIFHLERSIYNACSAGALHFMMTNWQPISWFTLWDIDTSSSNSFWFLFASGHFIGWFIIYSGCVMLDMAELVGLKQVYYKISGRPCPMLAKSKAYQRYLSHMRHPSFTGFLMVLWLHPCMTMDRFLLSSILTVYMLMMWKVDDKDCHYHEATIYQKRIELS